MVIGSKNISAAIIDLSPVGKKLPEYILSQLDLVNISQFKEPRTLPDWGYIFSEYVCFVRPVNLTEEKLLIRLIDDYLSILLSFLILVKPDDPKSLATSDRFEYQKRYCFNQRRNDKTRTILTRFFGSSWADQYIDEILFDC